MITNKNQACFTKKSGCGLQEEEWMKGYFFKTLLISPKFSKNLGFSKLVLLSQFLMTSLRGRKSLPGD